jgi:hypothetical protein
MPRMSAGRQPPAPTAGAVNLRGLTAHHPRSPHPAGAIRGSSPGSSGQRSPGGRLRPSTRARARRTRPARPGSGNGRIRPRARPRGAGRAPRRRRIPRSPRSPRSPTRREPRPPDDHLMLSMMVSPAPFMTALMTRSLVSRMATAGLTGTDQAVMAARTWPHACAAAAEPSSSRTRRCRNSAGGAGTAGAMVSITGPFNLVEQWQSVALGSPRRVCSRGSSSRKGAEQAAGFSPSDRGAGCTTNVPATCSARHRSADGS